MRKRILFIVLSALVGTCTYAQSYCHLVQDVGTYYEDTIESSGIYYYSAWTYDLPMDVYITSLDSSCSARPQVWADLTCNPGVYDDSNIQNLVNDTAELGVSVPMALGCETTFENGHYTHHLQLGKSYRNRLKLFGVDYNVRAYVKVILPCGSIAHLEQDTSSMACFKDARRIALKDATRVLANDSLNTYIFPIKDWLTEADSVALSWEGPEPAHLWINDKSCEFETDRQHSIDNFIIPANGEYHLSRELLEWYISEQSDSAGYIYVKIFSPEEGRFFSRALAPELYGATLMQLDSTYKVTMSDQAFYCFPKDMSWSSIEWVADTRKVVKMYLHSTPDSAPVDSFKFDLQDSTRRVLIWTKPEMELVKAHATNPLLFVRFECSKDFRFTPSRLGNNNYCSLSTIRIRPGVPVKSGLNYVYRLYYEDWEGYPMDMYWDFNQAKRLQLFIADTCQFEPDSRYNFTKNHSVYINDRIDRQVTITIDSATIAGWKAKLPPPDGFYYIRTNKWEGTLTFTTTKPEEQDPEGDDPEDPDPGPTTGMSEQEVIVPYQKILHNGQILIIRAGKAYSITGQAVKIE